MPKERSSRSTAHNSSVKLKHKSLEEKTVVEDLGFPANDLRNEELINETAPILRKKDKQQLKREALLQRIELTQSPYSKSHQRRLKRKAKEQIGQGLGDIRDALQSVDNDEALPVIAQNAAARESEKSKSLHMQVDGDYHASNSVSTATALSKIRSNQIGEGKGATLSEKQRKKELKTELLRQKLILSNPHFASNPFQSIRTHARNTLVKHVPI